MEKKEKKLPTYNEIFGNSGTVTFKEFVLPADKVKEAKRIASETYRKMFGGKKE